MMNDMKLIQESIEQLERVSRSIASIGETEDYTEIAINALEKQIAKRPIMKQYFEGLEEEYLCCPTCGGILTDRIPADNKTFYFYCMNCGQKFDWGDEE